MAISKFMKPALKIRHNGDTIGVASITFFRSDTTACSEMWADNITNKTNRTKLYTGILDSECMRLLDNIDRHLESSNASDIFDIELGIECSNYEDYCNKLKYKQYYTENPVFINKDNYTDDFALARANYELDKLTKKEHISITCICGNSLRATDGFEFFVDTKDGKIPEIVCCGCKSRIKIPASFII